VRILPRMSEQSGNENVRSFNEYIYLEAQKGGLYLGQLPNPMTGEKEVNLQAAAHLIGNLKMIREKTKGNLTEEESGLLDKAVSNLTGLYDTVNDWHEA